MITSRRVAYPAACAVALLVTIASYANHFHNAFHFDDSHAIENNAYVRSIRNIPLFFTSPRHLQRAARRTRATARW